MSGWVILLDIILILIFLITAVLITISSVNLYSFKNLDVHFSAAYNYSVWASVISWLIVALFIAALIGGVAFFIEAAPEAALADSATITGAISGFALFFLFLLLVLIFIIGVLSALTASNTKNSSQYDSRNTQMSYAYHTAIGAAVLALISSSIVFLWWIVDLIYYYFPPDKEVKEVKAD